MTNYNLNADVGREEFLQGKGRDLLNTFEFFFPDAQENEEFFSFAGENQMPASLFFLRGNYPANLQVEVKASLGKWASSANSYATFESNGSFSSELAPELKTFNVDYGSIPNFNRELTGTWDEVNIHFKDYRAGRSEYAFLDGSLDASCSYGKTSGTLRVADRGGDNPLGTPEEIPFDGTCEGDSATITFEAKYHSQDPVDVLTFKVEKITRGFYWSFFDKDKQENSSFLVVKNSQGKTVGTIRVSRRSR